MASGTDWRTLQQRISRAAGLAQRDVGLAFLDASPPDLEKFEGTAPSGCSFWQLAAAGRPFYTVPHDHFNCAVGAHTHNTGLGEDEMYFMLRGKHLRALAEALEAIAEANHALAEYARERREQLASA